MEAHGKTLKWLNFSFKIALMIRQKYITNTEANWFLNVPIIRALWGLEDRSDGKGLTVRLDLTSILGTHIVEGKNILPELFWLYTHTMATRQRYVRKCKCTHTYTHRYTCEEAHKYNNKFKKTELLKIKKFKPS